LYSLKSRNSFSKKQQDTSIPTWNHAFTNKYQSAEKFFKAIELGLSMDMDLL
jgi:hypothetical protein